MTAGTDPGVQWSSRARCLLMNRVTENEVHKCDVAREVSQSRRLERKRETPIGQISALHGWRMAQWLLVVRIVPARQREIKFCCYGFLKCKSLQVFWVELLHSYYDSDGNSLTGKKNIPKEEESNETISRLICMMCMFEQFFRQLRTSRWFDFR